MKIEIELPKIEGFEYTGEFRRPRSGEYYLSKRLLRGVIAVRPPKYGCHILKDIRPKELTLEDKIKAKYPDYEVVMLKRNDCLDLVVNSPGLPLHITAQSMKGFYRYVFDFTGGEGRDLTTSLNVCCSVGGGRETLQPVAVLFTREK